MKEFDSDLAIIQAIKQPQNLNRAITHLYKVNYPILENMVLMNGGNKMDAEDVIQETMITFIEMIREGKFRGESAIKSILYSITKNLWITKFRKTTSENLRIEKYFTQNNTHEESVQSQIQKREAVEIVEKVFNKIGESCKKVLTLFYYENLSFKEILDQTDYENEQVLRNKKYKCLKSLIEMMEVSPSLSSMFKTSLHNLK